MGKGDRKSKKGKRWKHSYGNKRNSTKVRNKKLKKENQKRIEFGKQVEKIKMLYTQFDTFKVLEEVYEKKLESNPNDKDVSKSIKNISKAKKETLELLNKNRNEFIGYSVEEIFINNGQYERFVSIEFHTGSEAIKKYGSSIMGIFIFTQFEKKILKRYIGQSNYPRTSKNMMFEPSDLCALDESQIQELKTIGFNNKDIKTIYQTSTRYENRYGKRPDYKEVPGTIEIKVGNDGYDYGPMLLHILESRIEKNSFPLIPEEYNKYLALKLFYKKDEITEEEKSKIYEKDSVKMKPHIADIYIDTKFRKTNKLNEDGNKLFKDSIKRKTDKAKEAVDKEITKSSSDSFNKIIKNDLKKYMKALMLAAQFEPENLSTYGAKHSVRIGLKAFLHVVLRHCQGYQFGDWVGKRTTFEYRIKDVMRILKIIINNCQKDIDLEIDKENDFQLVKGSSYLYDGNYYSIHINKQGNLVSFHPRNK